VNSTLLTGSPESFQSGPLGFDQGGKDGFRLLKIPDHRIAGQSLDGLAVVSAYGGVHRQFVA
jgi:hypothetical protein